MSRTMKGLIIGLVVFAVLTPLGLLVPAHFGAGGAWGEWSGEELQKLVGYVPQGLHRLEDLWKAPLPDYALPGQEHAPLHVLCFSYIFSAVVGAAVIIAVTLLIGRLLARREQPPDAS
jgi:hypothetical protein